MSTTEYLNNKTFEVLIVKFQQAKREQIKYQMFMDDISNTEKRTSKRGKYQKPTAWDNIEKEYKILKFEYQDIQNNLAMAFLTLSQNIVRYAQFNLIDQDDAIQEGVMICFEKIDRFDPKKGKAFNYMTTCILNHFRQLYRAARNYNELKRKYLNYLQVQMDQQLPVTRNKNAFKRQNISNNEY